MEINGLTKVLEIKISSMKKIKQCNMVDSDLRMRGHLRESFKGGSDIQGETRILIE